MASGGKRYERDGRQVYERVRFSLGDEEFQRPIQDADFVRCFWPRLSEPTELLHPDSSGIRVQGPPTPRNVKFPRGTEFLAGTRGDCFFRERLEDEQVERQVLVTEPVDLGQKGIREVTYLDTVTVTEQVRKIEEIEAEEAAPIESESEGGDRVR